MTKQPKVCKPHPVLHGIGLVLSVTLLVAVLVGTYVLSTMATIIDSFIGAPSGHYSDAEIADTKVKAERWPQMSRLRAPSLSRTTTTPCRWPLITRRSTSLAGPPLPGWAAVPAPAACPASTPICWPR